MTSSRADTAGLGWGASMGLCAIAGCFSPDAPTGLTDGESETSGTDTASGPTTATTSTTDSASSTTASTTDTTTTDSTDTSPTTGEPDTTPPTIESFDVSPTTVSQARFVGLSATVSDDVGVLRVEFYADDELLGTATEEPYVFDWLVKTDDLDGDYQVKAVAYDTSENMAETPTVGVGIDLPPRGTEVWHDVVDGQAGFYEQGFAVAAGPDGRCVVAGGKMVRDFGLSVNTFDFWVREYTANGTESWTVTHNTAAYRTDIPHAVAIDPMGFVVVAGQTRPGDSDGAPNGPPNVRVIRYAPGGQSIDWSQEIGEAAEAWDAHGVGVDATGAVYVGGEANNNAWVAQLAVADGSIEWDDTYVSVAGNSVIRDVAVDDEGNMAVIGSEVGDIWLRKYNADQSVAWTRTIDSPAQAADRGSGVAIGPDGDIGAVGQFQAVVPNGSIWFARYDADGNLLWSDTYDSGSGDEDIGHDIALDAQGELVVTGMVEPVHNGINIWVARYTDDGTTQLWDYVYNGSTTETGSDDYGLGIAVDAVGYVCATGSTHQYSNPVEPNWDASWSAAIWAGRISP